MTFCACNSKIAVGERELRCVTCGLCFSPAYYQMGEPKPRREVSFSVVNVDPCDTVCDGRAPSNHTDKPSRAILVGDKVTTTLFAGIGTVVGYHMGQLVIVWPPQQHDADMNVFLHERGPGNDEAHRKLWDR